MGQQIVTHSCGHDSRQQMFGSHKERDRRAAWLASKPCAACQTAAAAGQPIEVHVVGGVEGMAILECRKDTYANRDRLKAAGYKFGSSNNWFVACHHKLGIVEAIAAALGRGWLVFSPNGDLVTAEKVADMRAKVMA